MCAYPATKCDKPSFIKQYTGFVSSEVVSSNDKDVCKVKETGTDPTFYYYTDRFYDNIKSKLKPKNCVDDVSGSNIDFTDNIVKACTVKKNTEYPYKTCNTQDTCKESEDCINIYTYNKNMPKFCVPSNE